jgi:quercetin dioxygenase-like cupin family protein
MPENAINPLQSKEFITELKHVFRENLPSLGLAMQGNKTRPIPTSTGPEGTSTQLFYSEDAVIELCTFKAQSSALRHRHINSREIFVVFYGELLLEIAHEDPVTYRAQDVAIVESGYAHTCSFEKDTQILAIMVPADKDFNLN